MQARPPQISVIINVHNGVDYLMDAIDSVLAQDYDDYELIIWDNCSTDGTEKVVSVASSKDPRIRSFRSKRKTSLYEARNNALAESTGDILAFLDSDDLWSRDKLRVATNALTSMEAEVFYSNFLIWNTQSETRRVAFKAKLPQGSVLRHLACNYTVALSSLVVRRSALQGIEGPFNPQFSIIGDFDLVLRLAARHKFSASDLPLVTYRVHGSNMSQLATNLRKQEVAAWSSQIYSTTVLDKTDRLLAVASLELDVILIQQVSTLARLRMLARLSLRFPLFLFFLYKMKWWGANKLKIGRAGMVDRSSHAIP